ncbi:putative RNA-directed DNA polymerase from transposon X-element [Portunus trituberculatus]|uniref:Putative RNA-directed DNA polymerase from transposon X-element n=1 Tax=Portunus trituberculatus TaxID=210409 RepID=A0A5B7JEX8_PORTR|nr:putative RNA-directed DNA polymerase from transposon X-element [Portunus trituberculatus]
MFTDDVNHNVATLTSLIISAQARHVPHGAYRVDPRDHLWFGYRCRQAADAKHKAWTCLKRRFSRRHKAQHRAACKTMARVATGARQSEAAVTKLLRSTDTRKAPGHDDVSPFLLKHCAEELTKPLTHIFRQCLQTSTWPAAWKEARVTSVNKKKDKGDPANYHPISLLSAVSKILERITAEQLTCHLEERHLISPQ